MALLVSYVELKPAEVLLFFSGFPVILPNCYEKEHLENFLAYPWSLTGFVLMGFWFDKRWENQQGMAVLSFGPLRASEDAGYSARAVWVDGLEWDRERGKQMLGKVPDGKDLYSEELFLTAGFLV